MPDEEFDIQGANDQLAQAISAYIMQLRGAGLDDEEIADEIEEITGPMLRGLRSG